MLWSAGSLAKECKIDGRTLSCCEECGLGYVDKRTAEKCEEWCKKYRSCSLEITKKAVYFPEVST